MKAIKINSEVQTNTGLAIPSGSLVIMAEVYAIPANQQKGYIPAQISVFVFLNEAAYEEKKEPITNISDFNTTFANLQLSVANYNTVPAEVLVINSVKAALIEIYGADNIEVVEVDPVERLAK